MPDKELENVKKQVADKVKVMAQKTEKDCKQAKELREEEADLNAKKDPSDEDKKKAAELRKALQNLERSYLFQADNTSNQINQILKLKVPNDAKVVPEWQKGMDKWYRDLIEKESGLDLGNDVKVTGEISIKDKKAMIYLKGKF